MTNPKITDNSPLLVLTDAERKQVEELRAALEDLISADAMARDHADDYSLWRFLVARDSDLRQAEAMFRGCMEWRKKVDIEALWEAKRVRKERTRGDGCFYAGLSGTTRDGGPVMVERLGRIDARGLAANRAVFEELKQSYIVYAERTLRKVRATGNKTRGITLVDASGLSRSLLFNISIIKEIADIGPPNYPEISSDIFIVNAPWMFAAAWKLVRPLIPRGTANKVQVCDGVDFLEGLRERVDDEHIPAFLGGGCTRVDDDHDDFEALVQPCPPPEPNTRMSA